VTLRHLWLSAGFALLVACGPEPPRATALAEGSTVLALGDSLTYGTGAAREDSWPTRLGKRTGWRIVNAGVPGDVSSGAAGRVGALLAEHQPDLVIISIGGNDFLRQVRPDQTRENIAEIVRQVRDAGADPVLVAVPRPTVMGAMLASLDDHPLYAEVAEELEVPLVAGAWSEVLSNPTLKSDALHANAAGYAKFTERMLGALEELGYRR
jgi:lysophospholipase L1-like esterase